MAPNDESAPRVPPLPPACYEEGTQTEPRSSGSSCGSFATDLNSYGPTASSGGGSCGSSNSGGDDYSVYSGFSEEEEEDEEAGAGVLERLSRGVCRLLGTAAGGSGHHQEQRCHRATQTPINKDPMVWETERLAFDIVFFISGKRSSKPSNEVMRCLRNSVQKMLDKHSLVFNGMMSRLKVTEQATDIERGFNLLADELFVREQVSWGKVIALYAFGAHLARHCAAAAAAAAGSNVSSGKNPHAPGSDCSKNANAGSCSSSSLVRHNIACILAQFAVKKLTPFLRAHGGWATLCDAYPAVSGSDVDVGDYEGTVWTSLLVTGVGLTTLAAFVALLR